MHDVSDDPNTPMISSLIESNIPYHSGIYGLFGLRGK